jgi:hypothetical protein
VLAGADDPLDSLFAELLDELELLFAEPARLSVR